MIGTNNVAFLVSALAVTGVGLVAVAGEQQRKEISPLLNITMKNIDGKDVYLGDYQGDVLMVVNVASKCGYTPQYKDLEALYRKYKDRGFKILAFPANNFGKQEPGTDDQIKQFCTSNYQVTFDLFSKISVKGDDQCKLYKRLTNKENAGSSAGDVRWNFQKYLIDRQGKVVAKFEPGDNPLDKKVTQVIEQSLEQGGS